VTAGWLVAPYALHRDQQAVALRRQLVDRAARGLRRNPGGDRAADFRGEVGLTEGLPPRFHGTGELVEEMPDAAAAAGQVKGQVRPPQGPAHARPVADRGVDAGHRGRHPR
jgi:hypothetical protein